MDSDAPQGPQPTSMKVSANPTSSNSAPQVRSRITVVCAECKRLKLKCDRRNPCASCVKRDTLSRCIYSPAAAEKVDLHSLNNRLIQVEATLAQITAGQFVSSYPPSALHPSHPSPPSLSPVEVSNFVHAASGSCLTFPLEDLTATWLDGLGLDIPLHSPVHIKTEPGSSNSPLSTGILSQPLPPLTIYYPDTTSPRPYLSPALLDLLPPSVSSQHSTVTGPYTLQNILHIAENSVSQSYPSLNWNDIRSRAIKMVSAPSQGKHATAMKIFFGQQTNSSDEEESIPFFATVCAALAIGCSDDDLNLGEPMTTDEHNIPSRKSKAKKSAAQIPSVDPSYWYALSVQALGVYEAGIAGSQVSQYNLDYLIACLLQVIFLIKDKSLASAGTDGPVFPLVGKMVNIARQIGLTRDPEEADDCLTASSTAHKTKRASTHPTQLTVFESEMRRRIWWDIVYYDLLVSDVMGHPPLVPDKSFSTRFPATHVDDKSFGPLSTHVPLSRTEETGYMKDGLQYLDIKCQLTQLIRTIKKRMTSPESTIPGLGCSQATGTYTIDQAALMESEVKNWLAQLPACFKLERLGDNVDPVLGVQRCEIAIIAQRLILKIYLPFLKTNPASPPYQAIVGTVNAAHSTIQAANVFSNLWSIPRSSRDRKPPLPAMFDFYPFPRLLFDAAVICAHTAIKHPTEIWATTAADSFSIASEILQDVTFWRISGLCARHDLSRDDASRILESIQSELRQPISSVPHKRKIDEATDLEADTHSDRANGPSAEVINLSPQDVVESPPVIKLSNVTSPIIAKVGQDKKYKKAYPSVGVRVRPGQAGFRSLTAKSSAAPTYRPEDSPSSLAGSASRSRSSSISQDNPPHFSPRISQSMMSIGCDDLDRNHHDRNHHDTFPAPSSIYDYHQHQAPQRATEPPPMSDYTDPVSPYADGQLSAASSPYTSSGGPNLPPTPNPQNPVHNYYFTYDQPLFHEPSRNLEYEQGHFGHPKPHETFQTPGQHYSTPAWPMPQGTGEYWPNYV